MYFLRKRKKKINEELESKNLSNIEKVNAKLTKKPYSGKKEDGEDILFI